MGRPLPWEVLGIRCSHCCDRETVAALTGPRAMSAWSRQNGVVVTSRAEPRDLGTNLHGCQSFTWPVMLESDREWIYRLTHKVARCSVVHHRDHLVAQVGRLDRRISTLATLLRGTSNQRKSFIRGMRSPYLDHGLAVVFPCALHMGSADPCYRTQEPHRE